MRSTLASLRHRSNSHPRLPNTIVPPESSPDYSHVLATTAARIVYRSPLPSRISGLPVYVIDSAEISLGPPVEYLTRQSNSRGEDTTEPSSEVAQKDAVLDSKGLLPRRGRTGNDRDERDQGSSNEYFDDILPYVLKRLPQEEELLAGMNYEIVFFAGGNPQEKQKRPVVSRTRSKEAKGSKVSNIISEGEVGNQKHVSEDKSPDEMKQYVYAPGDTVEGCDLARQNRPPNHNSSKTAEARVEYTAKEEASESRIGAASTLARDAILSTFNTKKEQVQRKWNDGTSSWPGVSWLLRVYQVLSRAMRKRLQRLWIVHEKSWIRVSMGMLTAVVSPKFSRKKVAHVSSLSTFATHFPLEDLLVPPTAYLIDRRRHSRINIPGVYGPRAFGKTCPLPPLITSDHVQSAQVRLPRVLRDASSFLMHGDLLKTEGLFRISAKYQMIEILREAYDRGQKYIVWQEGPVRFCSSHVGQDLGDVGIDRADLEYINGYDVHVAAGLIKLWYKELQAAIFPHDSYHALRLLFSGKQASDLTSQLLCQTFDAKSTTSPLSETARLILTMHLLPLLSATAKNSSDNKMPAANLAVCFAPSLLNGPDPMEDLQMLGLVRSLLTAAIQKWDDSIAPSLNLTSDLFRQNLAQPISIENQEDPMQDSGERISPTAAHTTSHDMQSLEINPSITPMRDHTNAEATDSSSINSDLSDKSGDDDSSDEEKDLKGALFRPLSKFPHSCSRPSTMSLHQTGSLSLRTPPDFESTANRQRAATFGTTNTTKTTPQLPTQTHSILRKPVYMPAEVHPPRYSTIITANDINASQLGQHTLTTSSHLVPSDLTRNPHRFSTETILPPYQEMSGPLPSASQAGLHLPSHSLGTEAPSSSERRGSEATLPLSSTTSTSPQADPAVLQRRKPVASTGAD